MQPRLKEKIERFVPWPSLWVPDEAYYRKTEERARFFLDRGDVMIAHWMMATLEHRRAGDLRMISMCKSQRMLVVCLYLIAGFSLFGTASRLLCP